MNHTELAWAAGFFDGEGNCLCWYQNGTPFLMLSIAQVDDRPLERFAEAVGYPYQKLYYKIRNPDNRNHSPQYRIQFKKFEQVMAIVAKLWLYLSEPKQEQIHEQFVEWQKNKGETRITSRP